jgi:hypothetical protein
MLLVDEVDVRLRIERGYKNDIAVRDAEIRRLQGVVDE